MIRRVLVVPAVALGAAVMAVGASADSKTARDPRGDTTCIHEHGHKPCSASSKRKADIIMAAAGHDAGGLRHTIRVVGNFRRATLALNTDSDPACELLLHAKRQRGTGRGGFRECSTGTRTEGSAWCEFHRQLVYIFFNEREIGNPDGYGWNASAGWGPDAGYAVDGVRKFNHQSDTGWGEGRKVCLTGTPAWSYRLRRPPNERDSQVHVIDARRPATELAHGRRRRDRGA